MGARQRAAALDLLTPVGHPLVVVAIDSSAEEGFDEVQYLFPPRRQGRVRPLRSVQSSSAHGDRPTVTLG